VLLEGGFVSEQRYHSNSPWPESWSGREAIAAGSQPSINFWGRPVEFMPLYMANSDLAQMKKPLALRSKKRDQCPQWRYEHNDIRATRPELLLSNVIS
jgi:hypothetical protein